jgi:hypothetical protein
MRGRAMRPGERDPERHGIGRFIGKDYVPFEPRSNPAQQVTNGRRIRRRLNGRKWRRARVLVLV